MSDVQVYIWDVERGDAILIKGPKENVVIDLGYHRSGFSPTEHIRRQHGVSSVDYLVVSHPDEDHIEDLPNFLAHYSPSVIGFRPDAIPYIKRRKNELYPDQEAYREVAEAYIELGNAYTKTPEYTPRNPNWNGGLTFESYHLTLEEAGIKPVKKLRGDERVNLNNVSILTIMQYGSIKVVTAGDLEKDALERLLQKPKVQEALKGTNILIAPHHGRESSYTPRLFKYITPDIVAISDKQAGSTNVSNKYSNQATGYRVQRRNGSSRYRNTVTTRQDGVLYFGINKKDYKVKID